MRRRNIYIIILSLIIVTLGLYALGSYYVSESYVSDGKLDQIAIELADSECIKNNNDCSNFKIVSREKMEPYGNDPTQFFYNISNNTYEYNVLINSDGSLESIGLNN